MTPQKTVKDPISVEGLGLFSGLPCTLRLLPAPENTGIVFLRKSDASAAPVQIPANIAHLAEGDRRTSLANGSVMARTVEHILAAVWAIGVDNIMWSSDYPHTASTWPRSRAVIERDFKDVDEEERWKILRGNVAKLYGFDLA